MNFYLFSCQKNPVNKHSIYGWLVIDCGCVCSWINILLFYPLVHYSGRALILIAQNINTYPHLINSVCFNVANGRRGHFSSIIIIIIFYFTSVLDGSWQKIQLLLLRIIIICCRLIQDTGHWIINRIYFFFGITGFTHLFHKKLYPVFFK